MATVSTTNNVVFQQDNVKCHEAKIDCVWLEEYKNDFLLLPGILSENMQKATGTYGPAHHQQDFRKNTLFGIFPYILLRDDSLFSWLNFSRGNLSAQVHV
ncbi:hypothetical protein TNCV_3195291 [Trichonephila clavipes]|uniref:Uncharacterized protein n=1 Tax=Trichonephila clavipes TaxID=2585209 RepID=A0A8X6RFG8_TRICX|nr:hypothetical protein TNCV_3195291 [Trichonephila clavipes]